MREYRNLLFGVLLLLLVDVIWVLSNELTKFLYQDEKFDKPFFCTYFKTSMFTFYLFAFAFLSPWRDAQQLADSTGLVCDNRPPGNYSSLLQSNNPTQSSYSGDDLESTVTFDPQDDASSDDPGGTTLRSRQPIEPVARLGESTFVPIKDASGDSNHEELSHTCKHSSRRGGGGVGRKSRGSSVDGDSNNSTEEEEESSTRSVRFNRMAEVREMSPLDAPDALLARLSYSASLRMRRQKSHHKTARTALMFSILWFVANYLYQLALVPSESALVTVLSSTSSLFTLLLAAAFPSTSGDRLTLSKSLAVLLSIGGVALISWSEVKTDDNKIARGIFMALMSAFFYAAYLVLVKRKSDTEEKINIPLFFGFVGLWTFVILWPMFLLLNFSHVEPFEWPNRKQFLILLLNGLVGTVISEAIWLYGVFLTSSLIGTLTITLQIPLAMVMDMLIRGQTYPPMFYVGSIPVIVSVVLVAMLLRFEDSDPALTLLKICYRKLFRVQWRHQQVLRVNSYDDDEQQESLINGEDDDDDDNGHNSSATTRG